MGKKVFYLAVDQSDRSDNPQKLDISLVSVGPRMRGEIAKAHNWRIVMQEPVAGDEVHENVLELLMLQMDVSSTGEFLGTFECLLEQVFDMGRRYEREILDSEGR